MTDWQSFFKGKKVTVMGLGLLGRGIGDIKFLAEEGAELIVTDLKPQAELETSIKELEAFPNIQYVLGEHRLEDFRDRDFILKAAGVPLDSPYINEAQKNNVPVEMSTSLFAALTPATLIGITGTRGKSTTTHLIHEILLANYEGTSTQVFLGGNVRGVATLPFLRETKAGDLVVLELDSWQLQGFGEQYLSPHIAVFTTLLPDHQNYYKNNMDAYLDDKANIFRYQKSYDTLILGAQVAPLIQQKYPDIKSQIVISDEKNIPADWQIQIPGEHNRYNITLAIEAAEVLGVETSIIKKAVEAYKGVSGRLEFIRDYNGIKIYNDTTATTPDATLAALKALAQADTAEKHTILIIGGADKNLDMTALIAALPEYCKSVIVLPGSGSNRIEKDLMNSHDKIIVANSLKEAVTRALQNAEAGDKLLLSPAFASFGMFKNEFDRGEQFVNIIKNL